MKSIAELNKKMWFRFIKVVYALALLLALAFYNLLNFAYGVERLDLGATKIICNISNNEAGQTQTTAKEVGAYFSKTDFPNGEFDYQNYFEGYNEFSISKIMEFCIPTMNKEEDVYLAQFMIEVLADDDSQLFKEYLADPDITSQGKANARKVLAENDPQNVLAMGMIIGQKYPYLLESLDEKLDARFESINSAYVNSEKASYLTFGVKVFEVVPSISPLQFIFYLLIGNAVVLAIFEAIRRAFYYIVLGSFKPKKS